jgi:hypothetical protein
MAGTGRSSTSAALGAFAALATEVRKCMLLT